MDTSSSGRVPSSTPRHVNDAIRRHTCENLERIGSNPIAIEARLRELDREWDIERATMAGAAFDAFVTLWLGLHRGRPWLAAGLAFLGGSMLSHVLIGKCPSLPLYRRLGIRTREEIDRERYALKARRGDFATAADLDADALIAAAARA
jgi:hypothetical protein